MTAISQLDRRPLIHGYAQYTVSVAPLQCISSWRGLLLESHHPQVVEGSEDRTMRTVQTREIRDPKGHLMMTGSANVLALSEEGVFFILTHCFTPPLRFAPAAPIVTVTPTTINTAHRQPNRSNRSFARSLVLSAKCA